MHYKPPRYLSEVRRAKARNLVDAGDLGLQRENGDLIDLHVLLTQNSVQVRLIKVLTNTMRPSGLHRNGIAIVDRSKPTKVGQIVHVRFNGDELFRRLIKRAGQWFLVADDPREEELLITDDDEVEKLGVVTAGIVFMS